MSDIIGCVIYQTVCGYTDIKTGYPIDFSCMYIYTHRCKGDYNST